MMELVDDKSEPMEVQYEPAQIPAQTISQKREVLAYLIATGQTVADAAKSVGVTEVLVQGLLTDERFNFDVKALQHRLYGQDVQQRFKEILPKAIDTAEEIMLDNGNKPGVRLNAAFNFMDRELGKPTQKVELGGSLIRQLYDRLSKKEGQVIDVYPTDLKEQLAKEEVRESIESLKEIRAKVLDKEVPKDLVDAWVLENL